MKRSSDSASGNGCTPKVPKVKKVNPDLYTKIPAQPPGTRKPGQFTTEQLRSFFEEGFVVVPDFFKPEELESVRDGVREVVDFVVNRLFEAGKIKEKHEDVGLFQRMTLIEKQFPGAGVLMHKYGRMPQSFRDLWTNDRLLNVMEQLIGPNIAGHPVWNIRVKMPQNEESVVPWHQDNAYLDPHALNVLQPAAWIPLLDTNAKNGCMQMARGGHRKGITASHQCCVGGTWYVELPEDEMVKTLGVDLEHDLVTCEVPYGGVLFLNNCIPHRSLTNLSNEIRWSLDMRWQRPDLPNGFYGLREVIPMRTENEPNLIPDFDTFLGHNKVKNGDKASNYHANPSDQSLGDETEFDTRLSGPWMQRWEMVHRNKHTDSYTPNQEYNWLKDY